MGPFQKKTLKKRCKHQDTKNLGKLGDGEPYIEGSFQKKGWDAVNDLIKASQEKDTISIIMNGAETLPATVLSEIKGKDISLNLDMENGFIWKINGTSITAETPADIDLSVTNTEEYIPAALYSLIFGCCGDNSDLDLLNLCQGTIDLIALCIQNPASGCHIPGTFCQISERCLWLAG